MSSPIPSDPYAALGISKDADANAIRAAHRKLVLKFHPDRIKDEADKAKGKDEFQKVQQAYELLIDPIKRTRYDDKIKLAELRKEAMMREPPRSTSYSSRAPPSSPPLREYRDDRIYETRGPSASYFDVRERDRYEEEPIRPPSRKYDDYDRKPSARSADKERKSSSKWSTPVGGLSFEAAFILKKAAGRARERTSASDKTREKEVRAAKEKMRDREERKERSEKHYVRHAYAEDQDSSDDSDTATNVTYATHATTSTVRPTRPSPRPSAKPPLTKRNSGRRSYDDEASVYDDEDKWERHHDNTAAYIQKSKARPASGRSEISRSYWEGSDDRDYSRRSGSDEEPRPTSSKGRRSDVHDSRRPPAMPIHNSSPANLRPHIQNSEPRPQPKSSTTSETRREVPSFGRSHTMPTRSKKETVHLPPRGSNLKHTETQDSGYGSSSPHTPEMRGVSPPSSRENSSRPDPVRHSSTRYQIVEPADTDHTQGLKFVQILQEEERHRRSPEPERSDKRERREKPDRPRVVTSERPSRTSSRRDRERDGPDEIPSPSYATARPSNRHESSRSQPRSPHDASPIHRQGSGRSDSYEDRKPSASRRYDPEVVATNPRFDADDIRYQRYRSEPREADYDKYPGSNYRDELRNPRMGRRESAH